MCAASDAELVGLGSTLTDWSVSTFAQEVRFAIGRTAATAANVTGIPAAVLKGGQIEADAVFLADDIMAGFITPVAGVVLSDCPLGVVADVAGSSLSLAATYDDDDDDKGNDSDAAEEQSFLVYGLSVAAVPVTVHVGLSTAVLRQTSGCTELNSTFVVVNKQLFPDIFVTVLLAAMAAASTGSLFVDSRGMSVEI